ncbi:ABC transporter ATP-binding protein [Pontibacter sp. G13]|uniref:ABC transporter ATP-binding protein n=1 Tax=Pontibacter sp. G13 TaxID=3074898 RepID=UPI00288C562B|nr:ABC transporter ATP-binding protein [Pontibacter sp. G13]WNJ18556.1 ABC transporter ATP-binding protein [Pontibacter sp. G13]
MGAGEILKVTGLVTEFRSRKEHVQAVKGIDFALKPGQTLGIVGESGSGKSVTSLSLMGLLPRNGKVVQGNAWFKTRNGETVDLLKLKEAELRKLRGNEIAMIFQEPMTSLNPVFKCGEQVAEAIRLHKHLSKEEARAETLELFRQVELPRVEAMYDSYPHELSGGQKQRVMIAMAMSCQPAVLIADEPTTALDVTVQKRILELMLRLQKIHGMALIFITHDLGVVAEIADEVLVMFRGKKMEQASVLNTFESPETSYTKGLLACRPRMDVRMDRLPTVSDFLAAEQDPSAPVKEFAEISREDFEQRMVDLSGKKPVMRVSRLNTWYPTKRNWLGSPTEYVKAVQDVSFDVYPGETLGLVGESGCGKTTLGRSILRLIEPTSGNIEFQDQELTTLDPRSLRSIRKDLQIIFQDPYASLNPRMTIGQAIMEPMKVHGIGKDKQDRQARMEALLEKVGLQVDHQYRFPHEFSGGQRQRVCIARALAVEPKFLICDESVSALDVSVQAQVLNLLKDLQEEMGLTYVFISHDLSVVKFMSDRIMVMRSGKMEEMSDAESLYDSPQSAYTQTLIEAIPPGSREEVRLAQERRRQALAVDVDSD